MVDAATKGALAALPLFLGIIANIIAFVSTVAFLNGILEWSGEMLGYKEITFEVRFFRFYDWSAIEKFLRTKLFLHVIKIINVFILSKNLF